MGTGKRMPVEAGPLAKIDKLAEGLVEAILPKEEIPDLIHCRCSKRGFTIKL
jgi:hypothetical protein